ncbi:YheC/YheD family protein [Alkalihalobacillus sp. MEB130]|uniref:YheC/YheD family endospore coat-associated protein n=1 Tax=Alkalihalobacillus sp. MEB130 TaxID=2976704 RepID=UPI0028DE414F|nr:YheC/YheD family protein [Alkalihalobacillus sp. MEB130]MDT8861212.1 YheC/YheD family protein [Alkalihalobacillus sp. MEB130]
MESISDTSTLSKPIVGVLTSSRNIRRLQQQKTNDKYSLLTKANKVANTTLYFFCYKDIIYHNKTIVGTYYDEEMKKWKRMIFPVPDILYNRGSRSSYNVMKAVTSLHSDEMKVINSVAGFSKWDVYKRLVKNKKLQPFLPLTKFFSNASDISKEDFKKIIKEKRRIYVKAVQGSRGKKVVRVEKIRNGYCFSHFNNQLTSVHAKNKKEVLTLLKDFFGSRSVIVQEGIDLLELDEQFIDMRAELQRNGQGELEVVAIPVRVGQKSSPISTHGDSFTFEDFYKIILSYSEEEVVELRKKLDDVLKLFYKALEKEYGPFGELGIDIALDKDGNIWYIECNAQSAKKSFLSAYDNETIERSFQNILEYAKYLYREKKKKIQTL